MQNKKHPPDYPSSPCGHLCEIDRDYYVPEYLKLRGTSLLQSPFYARACRKLYHQESTAFAFEQKGQIRAIAQIQQAGLLKNMLHGVILDRGPLWIGKPPSASEIESFFTQFNKLFPARLGRKRRILPEIEDTPFMVQALKRAGLKHLKARPGYQTLWLDLTRDPEELRKGFKGKWRNALRKAEKADLKLSWGQSYEQAAVVIAAHHQDMKKKGYQGTSMKTLSVLCAEAVKDDALLTGLAYLGPELIGGIVILTHGKAATYQISWNESKARQVNANYLLLWEAGLKLRGIGVKDLDLGGVNDKDASGVKRFKSGTGGQMIRLAGHFK